MSNTITLYRIEDPDTGTGPYTGRDWRGKARMRYAHQGDRHPAPWMDPDLGLIRWTEVCACDSPATLKAWFHGFWDALAAAGFEVRAYTVPADRVRIGKYGQAVFDRQDAPPSVRFDPTSFLSWFTRYNR